MLRSLALLLGLGLVLTLLGCGDTCESVQEDIQEIGREIQKNPASAMDQAEELSALKDKLIELDCLE